MPRDFAPLQHLSAASYLPKKSVMDGAADKAIVN